MTRKPNGFFSKMSEEEWMNYGIRKEYQNLTKRKLQDKEPAFYKKGLKERWLNGLCNGYLFSNMNEKQWLDYGKERDYDKLNRTKLSEISKGYYTKGCLEGWINNLIPESNQTVPRGFYSRMTEEEWIDYGIKRGYNKLNREDLPRAYMNKGLENGWINRLIPKTETKPDKFFKDMTKEGWLQYGKENKYDKLNRTELSEVEGCYYQKGLKKGWLDELIPKSNSLEQTVDMYIGAGK
jgi:hypothetical protein